MTERFQDGAQSLPKLLARNPPPTLTTLQPPPSPHTHTQFQCCNRPVNEVSVLFSQTRVLVMAMGTTLLRGKGGNLNDMQIQDEFIARDN